MYPKEGEIFLKKRNRRTKKLGKFTFHSIGIVHSPFKEKVGTPIQSCFDGPTEGCIEIFEHYEEGLDGVDGFRHIHVLYVLHRAFPFKLTVTPFLKEVRVGVFATRAPSRPNPIGLSTVELLRREGRFLHIRGLDMLDGTPVLDIKPYVPRFDVREHGRIGWMEGTTEEVSRYKADERFGE